MKNNSPLTVIGRAEQVEFPDFFSTPVAAKVDTGADVSSIWATNIKEQDDQLHFTLLGPGHPHFTGDVITISKPDYSITRIANSFGHKQLRYVVKIRIRLAGRLVRASFSLADRSQKTYPILIGRKLLKNKFLVDVAEGDPLHAEEKQKKEKMRLELQERDDTLGE